MEDNTPTFVINNERPKNTTRNILIAALVVLGIIVLVSMCRGYKNGLASIAAIEQLNKENDSLIRVTRRQENENADIRKERDRANEFADDQNLLVNTLNDTLEKSEARTAYLAQQIKKAYQRPTTENKPIDTIDIVNKCPELADAYINEVDKRTALKRASDSLDRARIRQLIAADKLTKHFKGRYDTAMLAYNSCIMLANSIKPRVSILAGIAGVYSPFVYGVGVTGAYQDRKGKLFQVSAIPTNHGLLYQGGVMMKISFKKR